MRCTLNKLSRRAWLKADFNRSQQAVRLPWVRDELEFTDSCSRCHDCIPKCPEKILIKGDGGFPEIDFNRGECTFCTECIKSCSVDLFTALNEKPWTIKAAIGEQCLATKKVVCVVCNEQCETEAISFTPTVGSVAQPVLAIELCTGCGACLKPCPTNAISFSYRNEFEHQENGE